MSSSVIIFHPGSRNLYFGRASDPAPQSILHVIARRRKSQLHMRKDTIVPISKKKLDARLPHEVESARLQLTVTLQSALKSVAEVNGGVELNGNSSFKVSLTDIPTLSNCNKNAKKTPVGEHPIPITGATKQFDDKPFIVGNDALTLSSEESFNVFCPWRRGQLNLNRHVGGSITAVVADLEDIWRWCITEKLEIPADRIKVFKAIVVVPAMFDRVHAKEIMNLLLNQLGFQSAFLVQDHVCASFGCGISCGTVVDVGDQKISVSCVEDGVSYPQSRIELKYGGGDLTVALWNQLQITSFPIPIDTSQQWDLEYLNTLKEQFCNLDLQSFKSGPKSENLLWNKPGELPKEYNVYFGDELLIVPLSYFNPDLLRGSIGTKAVISYVPQPSVSDDPFDKIYLAETNSMKRPGAKDNDEGCDDEDVYAEMTVDNLKSKTSNKNLTFEIPYGIDQAVVQSIESCDVASDLKRRWYSCIVVVGGGLKFSGILEWLKERMHTVASKQFSSDQQELPKIITSAKNEGDSATTAWKGASILSSLESAKDLWISESEWRMYGSKILREKSLFYF